MQQLNWHTNSLKPHHRSSLANPTPGSSIAATPAQLASLNMLDASWQGKYKGKTAYIFGSGSSLLESWDWQIPLNTHEGESDVVTFALNGGVLFFWDDKITPTHPRPSFRLNQPLNYWMCFDKRVFDKHRHPEREYSQIALHHPTAQTILPSPLSVSTTSSNYIPNVIGDRVLHYNIYKKREGDPPLFRVWDGRVCTGWSIIVPCLHLCLMAGFKNVVLGGCDMCYLPIRREDGGGKGTPIGNDRAKCKRYCFNCANESIAQARGKWVTAPNGERVKMDAMYHRHFWDTMTVIRYMQSACGVNVMKASERGMLDVPAVSKLVFESGEF
jgi:hypothetical protein